MDYVESLRFLFSNQESGGDSVLTWHYRTKSFLILLIFLFFAQVHEGLAKRSKSRGPISCIYRTIDSGASGSDTYVLASEDERMSECTSASHGSLESSGSTDRRDAS